jgi:hypothetical protein
VANPYLNRGESIILTTHRVSVDSVLYNVMLTSERLILLDDSYTSFRPRSIMLQDIDSLRSGKIPSGEPVIILSFTSSEKNPEPINLVFLLQYGEKRKEERDEWVKKIMELRIALIQKETPAKIPFIPHLQGLHPSVRHGIAPETIRPLSNLRNLQPEPVPFAIIHDEQDCFSTTPPASEDDELFMSPAESSSSIQKTEPKSVETESSIHLATEEIPGMAQEPLQPESEPDQPSDSALKIIEWPVIQKTEPKSVETESSIHLATEEIPGTAQEPLQPESEPDQPSDSALKIIEWPVIQKTEPESAETEPSAQVATEEIPGTVDESVLSNNASSETDPESFRSSITIALESLTTAGESEIPSDHPTLPLGENPAEEVEIPSTVSPLKQRLPTPSLEGGENPEGTSSPEIVTPLKDSNELSRQTLNSIPEQPMPDSKEKIVQMASTSPPHSVGERLRKNTIFILGCTVLSILVITGGVMILSSYSQKEITSPSIPVVNTTPFVTVKMTLSPVLIPQSGLWVRINSSGPYLGQAGNPDLLKPVSGTGNQMYKIENSNGIVQIDVKKQDNSGSPLSVEIYKDGYRLASRTVTAPMGSIDLLIDSKTGYPPGLYANGSRIL